MITPTFAEEYRSIDKSEWGPGPWSEEPDKAVWVDPETDLDCMVVRGPAGALCGYVGVGPEHPWHGVDYSGCLVDDCPEGGDGWHYECSPGGRVEVHGGLTFAEHCQPHEDGPERGICHIEQPGRPDPVWWFGFDCAHRLDRCPADGDGWVDHRDTYRDLRYVVREVAQLAKQLAAVTESTTTD